MRWGRRAAAILLGLALLGCEDEPDVAPLTPADYASQFAQREQPLDARGGQTLYVPIYSNILAAEGARPTEMAATLAIRNTDIEHEIFITRVDYYDTAGKLIESYLDGIYGLGPMASAFILINVSDQRGGLGANFLVTWRSETAVSDPVVEAIMVGASGTKGFSFTSQARVTEQFGG